MFNKKRKERFPLEEKNADLHKQVVRSLRMVFFFFFPVNVYDLGLIYKIDVDEDGKMYLQITLTAPNCPEAERIPGMIQNAVKETEGIDGDVDIELVFDPPWTREKMSTAALLALGLI